MPRLTARAASVRRDVARIVAQNSAAALTLVDPDESHEGAPRRNRRTVDEFPAAVAGVVRNFRPFSGCPTDAIIAQSLLPAFGFEAGQ
eukprot:4361156-Pleurochrysis_carterae.AAC.1